MVGLFAHNTGHLYCVKNLFLQIRDFPFQIFIVLSVTCICVVHLFTDTCLSDALSSQLAAADGRKTSLGQFHLT